MSLQPGPLFNPLYFIFAACRPFSDAGLLTDQRKAVGDGGQLIAARNVAGGERPLNRPTAS